MTPEQRKDTLTRQRACKGHRRRFWQAMRIMRDFCLSDLIAACEAQAHPGNVRCYLSQLRRAGYLRFQPRNGELHTPARYILIRNTGPHYPAIVRYGKAVWDPNTDQEYPIV